jgi:hypothetical protein
MAEQKTEVKEVMTPMIRHATGAAGTPHRRQLERHEFPRQRFRLRNRLLESGSPKRSSTAVPDPDHPQVDAIGVGETSDGQIYAPTGATAAHLDAIVEKVARTFHFSAEELRTRNRGQHLAFCRQVAMYLCRHDGASLPAVGRAFRRHHTTVLHDVRLIERRLHGPGHGGFRAFIEAFQRQIIPPP